MKKILFGIAIVLGMTFAASCTCNHEAAETVEEEVVETEVVVDSTVVEVPEVVAE